MYLNLKFSHSIDGVINWINATLSGSCHQLMPTVIKNETYFVFDYLNGRNIIIITMNSSGVKISHVCPSLFYFYLFFFFSFFLILYFRYHIFPKIVLSLSYVFFKSSNIKFIHNSFI